MAEYEIFIDPVKDWTDERDGQIMKRKDNVKFSRTYLLLFAQYQKAILPLEEICMEHFGWNKQTAVQKARIGELGAIAYQAVPRGPWLIDVGDLADFLDSRKEEQVRTFKGAA